MPQKFRYMLTKFGGMLDFMLKINILLSGPKRHWCQEPVEQKLVSVYRKLYILSYPWL